MTANSINEIKKVLSYYHDEVIPALAAAVTIDDRFPIEVLNEVRNAFTHLSPISPERSAWRGPRMPNAKSAKGLSGI